MLCGICVVVIVWNHIGDTDGHNQVATEPPIESGLRPVPSPSQPPQERAGAIDNDYSDQGRVVAVVRVVFPNGKGIDVALRNFVPETPPMADTSRLMDAYDVWATAGENGDGIAARHLYRSLGRCENVFHDSDSLESALRAFRQSGRITYPNGVEAAVPSGTSTSEVEEVERENFEFCLGVPREAVESRAHWAEKAAEAGDFLGSRDHARNVGLFTEEGLSTYQKLWARGHLSAAQGLAVIAQRGYESETGPVQPNPVKSYTYTLISVLIITESLRRPMPDGSSLSPAAINRIATMDQALAEKAALLTAEQLEYAANEAARLVEENSNCCLGRW